METRSITDYLNLYLGCEVRFENSNYYFVHNLSICGGENHLLDEILLMKIKSHNQGLIIKTILRPLSDMSEEEFKEVANLRFSLPEDKIQEIVDERRIDLIETTSIVFVYLLSKHFDLFGLIDAGIALDKTKI